MRLFTRYFFLLLFSFAGVFTLFAQKDKVYVASDVSEGVPSIYQNTESRKFKKVEVSHFYLTMRDGVQLAVSLYIPKGLGNEKIPAILHQTRYWRAADIRWPFKMFTNGLLGPTGKTIEQVILNGYAFVNVDARGSGASFGRRDHPWTQDEVLDGNEVVDWIISQDWSNKNVGTAGVSYSGTTAEFLLTNRHPNVKCALVMYSLFDVYDDNAFPGGVHNSYFTYNWGVYNDLLDKNVIPRATWKVKMLAKGVKPVDGKGGRKMLNTAIQDHNSNLNVHDAAVNIQFRDDKPGNGTAGTVAVFSPYTYSDDIDASGAAVYSISGWWDGGYNHAAIKRHLTLKNPNNKLMLGPWEHGGSLNCSPANPGKAGFDHVGEWLKFFDFYLKGKETGLQKDKPVYYFTMVEEKWKSADSWPPLAEMMPFYLGSENKLNQTPSNINGIPDTFVVDSTIGSSPYSRWRSLLGETKSPIMYPDRKEISSKLLYYDSAPLEENMEVTGHGVVTLYFSSTADDGAVHVYLEDVDPTGKVTMVTEGLLRVVHRKISDAEPEYTQASTIPYHSYKKDDWIPLIPGEVVELKFDLLPTSYLFRKGNAVRISIAGADKDNFKVLAPGAEVKIYNGNEFPSKVELPVIKR